MKNSTRRSTEQNGREEGSRRGFGNDELAYAKLAFLVITIKKKPYLAKV